MFSQTVTTYNTRLPISDVSESVPEVEVGSLDLLIEIDILPEVSSYQEQLVELINGMMPVNQNQILLIDGYGYVDITMHLELEDKEYTIDKSYFTLKPNESGQLVIDFTIEVSADGKKYEYDITHNSVVSKEEAIKLMIFFLEADTEMVLLNMLQS